MPRLAWDRLLETCVRREMNAILVAGQPPHWRSDWGLCPGDVPPVTCEELVSMLPEIWPQPDRIDEVPGCLGFRIAYGSEANFRIDTLGVPDTHTVVVTKVPSDLPASLQDGVGWYRGWSGDGAEMNLDDLLGRAERMGGDALVVPGCPPFVWSTWGLHAYGAPPFGDDVVCSMIDQIIPPPESRIEGRGVVQFRIRRKQTGRQFCVATFGYPSPTLALLTLFAAEEDQSAD